jgi:hypothetical protein
MSKSNDNIIHRFLDEAGDTTFYLKDKISVVSDIYDNNKSGYENGWRNIYNKKNPLTIQNKICPL